MDVPKPFLEHLEELRWMLVKSVIALALSMGFCAIFLRQIMDVVKRPLQVVCDERGLQIDEFLFTLNVVDPLTISVETCLFAGIIIAFPFLFFFVGQFVVPALQPHEKKLLIPAFTAGGILFIGGVFFCFFLILPQALRFFIEWNEWFGWKAQWPIQRYIGFVLQMLVAFGLSFELPLVIAILAKLGIVTQSFLQQYRRHAIVILVVFSACVTPTSDPFTLGMMFGPMYLLYEVSIFIAGILERKRKKWLLEEGLIDDLD
ncbi:MAG: twin-arginine translocase subunit TatC [Verrucomicrobiota bacterium]